MARAVVWQCGEIVKVLCDVAEWAFEALRIDRSTVRLLDRQS
jgi:hypothetical protein